LVAFYNVWPGNGSDLFLQPGAHMGCNACEGSVKKQPS